MNKKEIRIKKIIGQTEGVLRMIEEKRTCSDIIQQIIAIRSALSKLGIEIVLEDNENCKRKVLEKDNLRAYLESIFRLA